MPHHADDCAYCRSHGIGKGGRLWRLLTRWCRIDWRHLGR